MGRVGRVGRAAAVTQTQAQHPGEHLAQLQVVPVGQRVVQGQDQQDLRVDVYIMNDD